jgi:DNA-binding transcriptional MerR regulator
MSYNIDTMLEAKNQDELIEMVNETVELALSQQFVMKDIGITSRVFNHWIKMKIGTILNKVGDYKFTFTFVDLIWFNIIKELRDYGFPLEKIEIVKKNLMYPVLLMETLNHPNIRKKKIVNKEILGAENNDKLNLINKLNVDILGKKKNPDGFKIDMEVIPLHLLIGRFIFDRADLRLLIDINGNVLPCTKNSLFDKNQYDLMSEVGFDSGSYISISLLKFIGKFILKKENQVFVKNNNFLNENEIYILSLIREGKAKSITIKFEEKEPKFIEITEEKKLFAEARISEVLLTHGYQDIKITTQDGSIKYSNITTKKKLK